MNNKGRRGWQKVVSAAKRLQPYLPAYRVRTSIAHVTHQAAFWLEGYNNDRIEFNGELAFLKSIAGRLSVVIDGGAGTGEYAQYIARLTEGCRVHAFEPSPRMFAALERRLRKEIAAGRVVPVKMALGRNEGEAPFHTSNLSGLDSMYHRTILVDNQAIETENIVVPITTIDKYLAQQGIDHVDLLKLDVEGAETDCLFGALATLTARKVSIIQFEYGGTWFDARRFLSDALELLLAHGYTTRRLLPNGDQVPLANSVAAENFQYQNLIATCEQV